MSLFRRRRLRTGGAWSVVRNPDGSVVGLWLESPADARDGDLIATLLAWQDALHLADHKRMLQNNTTDEHGGVFVLFADAAGEFPRTGGIPAGADTEAGRSIAVDGTMYLVHKDFAAFAADAAANKVALLRTRFDVPLRTHMQRLMPVLTEAYGPDAPQTRAMTEGGFHCLACFADHSRAALLSGLLGDGNYAIMTSGSPSRLKDQLHAKSCTQCGGKDAVWIYDPSRRPR